MTGIPKDGGDWTVPLRRLLAARTVRGRRRLLRESGVVEPIDTRPMRNLSTGEIVYVPLMGNDLSRVLIAMIGDMDRRGLVALARKHGIAVVKASGEVT